MQSNGTTTSAVPLESRLACGADSTAVASSPSAPPAPPATEAASGSDGAQPDGAADTDVGVALYYESGWGEAQMHASMGGGEWGVYELERKGEYLQWAGKVPADAASALLEFVVTDKQGDWDKPPNGGNYVISERGSFLLKDGQLSRMDD